MVSARRSKFAYLACALGALSAAPPLVAQRDVPSGADVLFFEAYRRSDPITNWPLKKTLHHIPELKGLTPATDQSQLPEILRRVGENLQNFVENFINTAALETIEETEKGGFGRTPQRIVEKFRYLMLARPEGSAFSLVEYRTDLQGREEPPKKLNKNFIKTTGFVSMPLFFGPLEQPLSDFRHLGQQTIDGRRTEAVAFAEHVWPAAVMGRLVIGDASVPLLLQGVAWIHASDYQILRMRTDLLAPLPPLTRVTTIALYANNQFEGSPAAFWLPQEVKVTVDLGTLAFANRHTYSDYRLFRAESVIKPDSAAQHP
jgi:hypothetical protein